MWVSSVRIYLCTCCAAARFCPVSLGKCVSAYVCTHVLHGYRSDLYKHVNASVCVSGIYVCANVGVLCRESTVQLLVLLSDPGSWVELIYLGQEPTFIVGKAEYLFICAWITIAV